MNKADQRMWGWAAKARRSERLACPPPRSQPCKIKGRDCIPLTRTRLEEMVWPEDISLETLAILDTRGLLQHFRPARVQVLGSLLNQKEGQASKGSKPKQEFNYQIRSDE